MKKLFLFDIDRTLIVNSSDKSYAAPIKNLHNLDVDDNKDFSGKTDQLILAQLLETKGWSSERIEESMPGLIKELVRTHRLAFNKNQIKI